jgi:cytochrome c oxidase cbb3-type subunit 3
MYGETLRGIAGIGTFPALSLVLFVIVFAIVLVRVARMDRASVRRFESLPLEDGDDDSSNLREATR